MTTTPYRFGGWSGIVAGSATLMVAALTVVLGPPPADPEELLRYLSRQTAPWAGMAILGIVADLALLPFAYASYRALREEAGNVALAGCGLLAVFALLDLAVRWPTIATLVTLAGPWRDATTTELEPLILGAGPAAALLGSFLWPIYTTLIPGGAILLISVAWSSANLGRVVAYVGAAVGLLGVITVLAGTVVDSLAGPMLATTAAMGIWFGLAGYALTRLPESDFSPELTPE